MDIKEGVPKNEAYYKHDIKIKRLSAKIEKLTLDVIPKEVMQNMMLKSK